MKRIAIIMAFIAVLFTAGEEWEKTAQAQAGPDHDAILVVLVGMKQDINKMIVLVNKHKSGNFIVGPESVTMTSAQKTQLLNKYIALKADLATQYAQLP